MALGASRQSVTNWKKEGLPSKYHSQIDDFFGKPYGWTELGIEAAQQKTGMLTNNPERLEAVLGSIGSMFRFIPESEWAEALLDVAAMLQKRGHFR